MCKAAKVGGVVAVLLAVLLWPAASIARIDDGTALKQWVVVQERAILTWYGDEYVGRRHAASWHDQVPAGFPHVVTVWHSGVAAPRQVPFGTRIRLTRLGICGDPSSEEAVLRTEAVVLDRMNWRVDGQWDAWPATARDLGFGPQVDTDCGCVLVRVEVLRSK